MSALEARILDKLTGESDLGAQWEILVRANPNSGFMQSLHWAEVKRRQGLYSLHIGIFMEGALIGGAIFYSSMKRNGAGILVAPEGPVLPWDNEAIVQQGLKLLIDTAQSHAGELGIMAMRIEPRLAPPPIPALREFGRAPINLVPCQTLYIDLTSPLPTILESMKPKGRYNIALSSRNGITASENNTYKGIKSFYSVVSEASARDGFSLEPLSFFEHVAAVLCSNGIAKFLFVEHEGDILGSLLLITYGSRATYLYGGIANQKRNLMGGYALQWAAIQLAKEAGCSTYDFYGIDPFRAPEHRYSRFSQFKSQFGGEVVRFIGAQEYFFLDNLADAFIKAANESNSNYADLHIATTSTSLKTDCLV